MRRLWVLAVLALAVLCAACEMQGNLQYANGDPVTSSGGSSGSGGGGGTQPPAPPD
ncbi:MAG TPA: hypothetical protein PLD23_15420 [Armatimonadota bacterium]|nr:hypothetical protein [Armatimonadota bacterium]HQK94898.1 hypothetical protein [Armatimonadota bacterium]